MSIESALYSLLSTDATLIAITSSRIYSDIAPTSAVQPYLTFQVISEQHERHLLAAQGLVEVRVQVDAWATTSPERRSITDAVREALDGYSGLMGTETLDVRRVFLDGNSSSHENPTDASEQGSFRGSMDFIIWHTETVPTF